MPELPEVETIVRDLRKHLIGQTIKQVQIYDSRILRTISSRRFAQLLQKATFKDIKRRGKAIIFSFQNGLYLITQVKMTGYFVYGAHLREEKN